MAAIRLASAMLRLDASGAVWWAAQRMLVMADLHLETGGAMARRGTLLPPYDTHATLARLEALVARYRPAMVVSLGDGFHDRRAGEALDPAARARLRALTDAVDWLWLAGNHDPEPPPGLGGRTAVMLECDGILFRHHPGNGATGEVAGHLHPKARLAGARHSLSRPCFVEDGRRLVLPAFGTFTGGLDVLDPAVSGLFAEGFDAWLCGEARVFRVPHDRLAREPGGGLR
jgi:hypothetical protein